MELIKKNYPKEEIISLSAEKISTGCETDTFFLDNVANGKFTLLSVDLWDIPKYFPRDVLLH